MIGSSCSKATARIGDIIAATPSRGFHFALIDPFSTSSGSTAAKLARIQRMDLLIHAYQTESDGALFLPAASTEDTGPGGPP
jgi:hypothetical protein